MHIQSPRLQTRSISSHSSRPRTCDQIPTCNADSKIVQRPAVSDVGFSYQMITTQRGTLLMLNEHTYSYNLRARKYYCSRSISLKCKSSVKLDENGYIVSLKEEHNHPPPKYTVLPSGMYLKI
ncbi:uncharacterized protein LOC125242337 isoform X2 [Leguminivora glycinivorella]|uniref:uncharacterized protein LOC125242337 isoform X2 n=1 Tax=Leguminivora glycinivorella TaxID=1035111 RepID=UPI00200F334A|nr:uncharacterized protein LOC125242337 isoform X2 [Leguminivora glycinivorella]